MFQRASQQSGIALPSWRWIGVLLSLAVACNSHAVLIGFSDSAYVIVPGETVAFDVLIQTSAGEPEGLFSYGVKLVPSTAGASFDVIAISVPPPLDFFGVSGPGALIDPSAGVLGAKGNIDIFSDPMMPYDGQLLATFELRFDALGEYEIGLDFFGIVGPTEQVFLSGDGSVLDGAISFETTTLRVLSVEQITPELSLQRSGAGNTDMDLRFATLPGLTYTAQVSGELLDWIDLVTTEGDGEEFFFRHVGGASERRNFYRVTATTDGS